VARRLGLLRSLVHHQGAAVVPVTVDDLTRAAELSADLLDPAVMDGAWR
jgi:hypothetical protein